MYRYDHGPSVCDRSLHYRNQARQLQCTIVQSRSELVAAGGYPDDRAIFEVAFLALNGTRETLEFEYVIANDPQISRTCAGPVTKTRCYMNSLHVDR